MKLIYYPPAFLLSRAYAYVLRKKYIHRPGLLKEERIVSLLKAVKRQMYSPRRNAFVDLVKNLIAAYFIAPGDVVIDAGAHFGRFALYFSSLVGIEGKVHAYEAHPKIFQRLNDRLKKIQQVSLHNRAVSNQSQPFIEMRVYLEDLHQECATVEAALMSTERMPGNTVLISVPSQKLDVHLDEAPAGQCSFIKIDVEGHEHAVIDGSLKLLQKHRPVVVYEYGCEPGKFEPRTIEQMEKQGYVSYDCATLKPVHPKYMALVPTDLVAIPKERVEEAEELLALLR